MVLLHGLTHGLTNISLWSDFLQMLHWDSPANWTVLAQYVKDPDVLGQMQKAFTNFIESGQVWALGIGFFLGYLLRGMTA